jgi:hypothetical protein
MNSKPRLHMMDLCCWEARRAISFRKGKADLISMIEGL